MTGKAKLEALTNSWYGFYVFSAISSVLADGVGLWTLSKATVGLLFGWALTYFLGRSLIKKSSVMRAVLIVLSAVFVLVGTVSAARNGLAFVREWELGLLVTAVYSAFSTWMNMKSFRTLTDDSVKSYFA